jgi:hemerythrin-like domain-containing protein
MKSIVLERLQADHQRYESLLCVLDRQLHVAACHEIPDYSLLAELFHYLTRQPEEWHHRVEDELFERLAERQLLSRETLDVLLEEHRRIETYGRELEAAFRQMQDKSADEVSSNLLNLAKAFSELYHHHLHTENRQVFSSAAQHVQVDDILPDASLNEPADGGAGFEQLYRQIAADRTGLQLGHGAEADYCPLCDAHPEPRTRP